MSFFIGVLTVLLVINCLVLIFLVLIQLPKKEAGAGVAFGGAAADALFGAGSGNFLTQATKYATIVFFILALVLGYFGGRLHKGSSLAEFEKKIEQKQVQAPFAPQPSVPSASTPAVTPSAPTNDFAVPTQSK